MESNDPPAQRLYSDRQISIASLIGSPVAACWFMARNYRQLGNPESAVTCFILGVIGTVALCVIGYILPVGFSDRFLLCVIVACVIGVIAKHTQGKAVAERIAAHDRLASWWTVVGISLLFFAAILAVVFVSIMVFILVTGK